MVTISFLLFNFFLFNTAFFKFILIIVRDAEM